MVGPPITTILNGPFAAPAITPDTEIPVTFTFAADRADVTYACSLDGADFTPCTSPITYTEADLRGLEPSAVGEHTFEVQATNTTYGFIEEAPASRTFIIDDQLDPETTIDSGPAPTTSNTSATLIFSSNELDATFECSFNGEPFTGCSSPYELNDLALGTYTLEVVAIDAAGHRDPTSVTHTWTVVAPPQPNTPNGTDVIVTLTNPVPATVTFAQVSVPGFTTVTEVGAGPALPAGYLAENVRYYDVSTTAEYSAPVTVCVPYTEADYMLPVRVLHHDGTEWIDVTASTFAGVACGVADTLSPFAVAAGTPLVVPETTLEGAPESPSPLSEVTFEFSSNDATADFECKLDDPLAWTSCDTPYIVDGLLPGEHEMQIRAVNAIGNADATPIVHRWTTTPPDTTIHTGPPASTISITAGFTFSSNDPLATFQCSLDGESFSSCETPHLEENLLAGNHELLVRATNDAGTADPTPASYRWTVRPLPDTAIINRPGDPSTTNSATFTFVSNLPGVTFECALDEAVDSQSFSPCTSPVTYSNLIFGEHDFAVRAKDADGNVDPTPAEWGWDVEIAAPAVNITSGPNVTTESRTARFDFSAEGREIRYECSLDGSEFSLCVSPKIYNGVPIGPHEFAVRVLVPDEAAEAQETLYEWTVIEANPPETNIVFGPPDPSYDTDPDSGGSIATFAFESDEAPVTFECALDSAPFTECPDPSVYTGLPPGQHILRVRAVDLALNVDAVAGELDLDGRARLDRAGHHDQHRRDRPCRRRGAADLLVHRERAARRVRVLDRRAAVRGVRVADGRSPT